MFETDGSLSGHEEQFITVVNKKKESGLHLKNISDWNLSCLDL